MAFSGGGKLACPGPVPLLTASLPLSPFPHVNTRLMVAPTSCVDDESNEQSPQRLRRVMGTYLVLTDVSYCVIVIDCHHYC